MTEAQTKSSLFSEIQKILRFWIKAELILLVITTVILIFNLITGNLKDIISVKTLKLILDTHGGISLLIGFFFLFLFSLTSNREYVVRTAARFRAPNQLHYSDDILKRQMSDFHRAFGSALVIICGFLSLGISYRSF
ncbi:MAG: hypothetical protein ACFFAU_17140 [Candidatus Hodarchaeota archaeon]